MALVFNMQATVNLPNVDESKPPEEATIAFVNQLVDYLNMALRMFEALHPGFIVYDPIFYQLMKVDNLPAQTQAEPVSKPITH